METRTISLRAWNKIRKQGTLIQRCQIIGTRIFPCIYRTSDNTLLAGDVVYIGHGLPAEVRTWTPDSSEILEVNHAN